MKPISLFGSGSFSYSRVVTSQRRLNCFYDIRQDGDKSQLIIRGTPGTTLYITMPSKPIRGWRVVKNILYAVAGPNLYSVTTLGVITFLGSITLNQTNFVSMSDNSLQVIIVDGTAGFTYTIAGGAFSVISDANFPNGCTTVSFLDGRFQSQLPNSRLFAVSASYDGTTWTPVIQGAKENTSDNIVAVEVYSGLLILWGVQSIEFWQDLGLSPLPYQRINGASSNWGLAAVWSRAEMSVTIPGNSPTGTVTPVIIFLGNNPSGGLQILMANGTTLIRVSDSDIENIINSFSVVSDAVALSYVVDGHPMYQLTFPTGGRSILFDALSGIWQEVQTGVALQAVHFGTLGVVFNSTNYISDSTTGNVYQVSDNSYTDNGAAIKRQITSMHLRNGGAPFSIDELYLDMETGVGLQAGQGIDPKIMMQISKDGGRTFGAERWKSLGKVGQFFSPRVVWNRLGQSRDFVAQFTMTDPVKFTLTSGFASSLDEESIVVNQAPPVYTPVDIKGSSISTRWLQWFNWLSTFVNQLMNYATAAVSSPVTGFSITVGNSVTMVMLTPSGTLSSGTVTMPAAPYDGMPIEIASTQTVTSFTLSPNNGQSIKNAPTTLIAGTGVAYFYNASSTAWFRRY